MTPSVIIRSVFKFTVFVIFFLITIEICIRLDDTIRYGAPLLGVYNNKRLRTISEADGYPTNIPNASFEKWQNNNYGFRGPDINISKPSGVKRVVCLGASETYGSVFERSGKDWPSQLSSVLPGSSFQVINVSVVGMELRVYESYLKKYVLKFKPDVVICLVNPMFSAIVYERQKNTDKTNKSNNKSPVSTPLTLKQKILANLRSITKTKQILKSALQESFPQLLIKYQIKDNLKQLKEGEALRLGTRKPMDLVSNASVSDFKSELGSLVLFLKSQGITPVLSTYPTLMSKDNLSEYPEIFLDNRRFSVEFSEIGMIDVVDRYNIAISEVAKEYGTYFVDAHTLVPKTLEYFGDNVHYTERASNLIADEIASQLLNKPSMPSIR